MLLLDTPVHGSGQHGEVAEIVAHPAAMVDILAVAFADMAGLLHFATGGITLRTTFFLYRRGMIRLVFPLPVSFFHNY
jgi:hypothetical protein